MSARLRMLVVDDDASVRGAMSRMLVQLGHEPVCVPSVEQAVHHLSRAPVDVLFLDLQLPRIDGMTLLRQLHAKSVPVIVIAMSGGPRQRDVAPLGARFIQKPFGPKELEAMLAAALPHRLPAELEPELADDLPDEPPSAPTAPVTNPVIERARGAFRGRVRELLKGDGLPVLDARVVRIHELLVAPECSKRDVEDVIGNDPRLTADVLRAANSPQFRGAISINSLGDAIVRLGNKEVMGIVMNATIRASFPASQGFWRELIDGYWDVGVASGRLARQLATHCEIGSPDEAFVAGLLHNIGELIAVCALTTMPERSALESFEPEVRGLIASQHQALGQRVLTAWELPSGLARLAGDHHGPLASLEPDRLLARVAWEIRTCSEEHPLPEDWAEGLERLGLRAGKLEAMLGYALPVRPPPEEAKSDAA